MTGSVPSMQPGWGIPVWHHHHSSKMFVTYPIGEGLLLIEGSAAKLQVEKDPTIFDRWQVSWEVRYSRSEQVRGSIFMDTQNLKAAFGLTDESGRFGSWLLEQYGGTCANQGMFIRYGNYLNIPCPGTGHDGDPNISIELDKQMQEVMEELVKRHGQ